MLVAGTGRIAQVLRITGLTDAFALHSCVLGACCRFLRALG
jgi:hypothetical protein